MHRFLILSLVLTLVLELFYAWIWGVRGKDFLVILLMNLLTNPRVVMWYNDHRELGLLIHTVLPELVAVITEILILKWFAKDIRKPVLLGICINTFSFFAGLIYVMIRF